MRVKDALACAQRLTDSDSPRADIETLLMWVLDKPRSYLYTWPDADLSPAQAAQFSELIEKRRQGEPVAHLVGFRDFWTLRLAVSNATLIPRPETEMLVEWALEHLPSTAQSVADLGTGTGAIALALASERPNWQIIASDRIPDAIELARRNALMLNLPQVDFRLGSWLEPLQETFHLIVSNPPYIDPQDPHLDKGDVRFEPRSALVADEKGLADIRWIITQAPPYLVSGGWLVFEHGFDQAAEVRAIFEAQGYQDVFTRQDLSGHDRITGARTPH